MGGTGMKLRLGDSFTRDSADLDTATRSGVHQFVSDLRAALTEGWGDFTGVVVDKPATRWW